MAKTKAQKQKDYIECLKTKYRAADLESEPKQKKKKLEQLQKDEAAYNLHLPKKKIKPIISIQCKISTENSSLQKAKIQNHDGKRRKS